MKNAYEALKEANLHGQTLSFAELIEVCPAFIEILEDQEFYEVLHSLQNEGPIQF